MQDGTPLRSRRLLGFAPCFMYGLPSKPRQYSHDRSPGRFDAVMAIAEHLSPSLLDKADWSQISCSQWGRANTKITLAPIVDPESLRERVQFGTITRIDGRTVYIKVDHLRSTVPCSLFANSEIHQRDVRLGTRKLYASRISDKKFGDKILGQIIFSQIRNLWNTTSAAVLVLLLDEPT